MPGPPPKLRRRASPERQSVVLGERAISAADRGARECGVSQRTGANRSSAGFGAVWDRQNNYVGASAVDVAWGWRGWRRPAGARERGNALVRELGRGPAEKSEGPVTPESGAPFSGARPPPRAKTI